MVLRKTDVLLVSPHSAGGQHSRGMEAGLPLGLLRIGAVLKRAGARVSVLNLTPFQDSGTVDALLKDGAASLVDGGVSGVSMNMSSMRGGAYEVIKTVKGLRPDVLAGAGGHHATQLHSLLIERLGADFVALGEAEESFAEFCRTRKAPAKGVAVKGQKTDAEATVPEELDALPAPDYSLVDLRIQKFLYARPIGGYRREELRLEDGLVVESSRGCPWGCSFCAVGGRRFRAHSAGYMREYLGGLIGGYGFNSFTFVDDNFTFSREHVLGVCEAFEGLGQQVMWAAQARADSVDEEMLGAMARAGCRLLAYGVESGSADVQLRIGKKLDLGAAEASVHATRDAGIRSQVFFLAGHPGEGEEDVRRSVGFVEAARPDELCIDIVKAFPGTLLYREMLERGLITDEYWLDATAAPPVAAGRAAAAARIEEFRDRIEYAWYRLRRKPPERKLMEVLGPALNAAADEIDGVVSEMFAGREGAAHVVVKGAAGSAHLVVEYYFDTSGGLRAVVKLTHDGDLPPGVYAERVAAAVERALRLPEQFEVAR